MTKFRVASRQNALLVFLLAGFALFMAAGCGGGKSDSPKYDVQYPSGHFRGVIYATDSPALGETPLYEIDFTQNPNGPYIIKEKTYQSADGTSGGRIDGLFGYSYHGFVDTIDIILTTTYRSNTNLTTEEHQSFYQTFGPPTNNGTHYEGELIEIKSDGFTSSQGPRHKAVFNKVP